MLKLVSALQKTAAYLSQVAEENKAEAKQAQLGAGTDSKLSKLAANTVKSVQETLKDQSINKPSETDTSKSASLGGPSADYSGPPSPLREGSSEEIWANLTQRWLNEK